ncbi:MAG: hypothetical protein NVS3B19_10930 [Ginsengibacter sp.]
MARFKATIKKFGDHGEKTGWTYVEVPPEIIAKIKGAYKKSFRVKGMIDHVPIKNMALIPMGEGFYILCLKAGIRIELKKIKGDKVDLDLSQDETGLVIHKEFELCLSEDEQALVQFNSLPKGHKNYFNNWISTAKTAETVAKRIVMVLNALSNKMNFAEMVRAEKAKKIT